MIELNSVANMFETGINSLMPDNIVLKIWTDVGKYEKPVRSLNSVQYTLPGILACTSSTNSTASGGLILGLQALVLEIKFPQRMPITAPGQAQQDDYEFVQEIRGILDTYFSANKSFVVQDGQSTYKVGMGYGLSVSGTPELSNHLGPSYSLSVYINLLYAENGINSRDIVAQFDGVPINFETANPSRSATVSTDIYSGSSVAKNVVTSTAFSIDCTLPSTTNNVNAEFVDYLLNGKPNTAHFVKLTWGTVGEKLFLMTQKDIQASISGVENVGLTMPLIEVVENAETLNYPAQFYVAMLYLTNSTEQISVILPAGTYYFNGSAFELTAQTELSPFISSENLIYNEQKQAYGVLLISLNTVTPSGLVNISEVDVIQEGTSA